MIFIGFTTVGAAREIARVINGWGVLSGSRFLRQAEQVKARRQKSGQPPTSQETEAGCARSLSEVGAVYDRSPSEFKPSALHR
jgi:hypothetical protein